MRVFAISDVHVDYPGNVEWIEGLSDVDYHDDVLILAGDVSDVMERIASTFHTLVGKFRSVLYVPGNHELWVRRCGHADSIEKFHAVLALARECGVHSTPCQFPGVLIVPLFGWYDESFGAPSVGLRRQWMDFRACQWEGRSDGQVVDYFLQLNTPHLQAAQAAQGGPTVVSFSHFLPRLDVMPTYIPAQYRALYPVLGTERLDAQVQAVGAKVHVYGHSHVNRQIELDGRRYVNNALGGPSETRICARELVCVFEGG